LQTDPDYPNANRRLGNLYVDGASYEQAVPLLEKAYAAEPTYQATTKGLGLGYTWLGRTQEAACVLNKLPDATAMSNELVTWSTFRREQQQDLLAAYALDTATIMSNYQQTNMDVWVLLGDLYKSGGNDELAQQWYSRVLDRDPANAAAQERLSTLGLERVRTASQSMCPT
jgi:tetratricopeptide (TPR) repeat protein